MIPIFIFNKKANLKKYEKRAFCSEDDDKVEMTQEQIDECNQAAEDRRAALYGNDYYDHNEFNSYKEEDE